MATKHEVEAKFTLKDEMSVQLEGIRKRAAALEKDAKGLVGQTDKVQGSFAELTKGIERFVPGLGRATAGVQGLASGLSPLAIGVGVFAGGVVAATGVVASWTKEIVGLGSELTDLAAKAKVSTDFVQEFGFAGKQVGVEVKTITDGVAVLSRRLGADLPDARKAVEGLGLSMADLVNQSPEKSFREIITGIQGIQNPAKQAAAAMALFGRQGLDFLPLIRSDISGTIDEFRALGGVIDSDVLSAGDKLGDQIELLTAAFTGLKGEVAGEVIPVLTDLTQGFIDLAKFVKESKEITKDNPWAKFFEDIHTQLNPLTRELTQAQTGLRAFVGLRELNAIAAEGAGAGLGTLPPPPSAPAGPPRPGGIQRLTDKERLRVEKESAQAIQRIAAAERDSARAAAEANKVYNDQIRALRELDTAAQAMVSGVGLIDAEALGVAESWASTDDEIRAVSASMQDVFVQQAKIGTELGFHIETWEEIRDIVDAYPEGVGDIEAETLKLEKAQQDYNQALAAANDIAQLLGGTVGSIVGQTLGAAAALQNLDNIGGTFSSASEGAGGGFFGALAGAGAVAGALAPLIGPITAGIKALFSIGGPDIGRDVGRDIGANISEGLEEAIEKSGKNAQEFLREIFEEGGLSIDRFAEEVGDLFSFFERGEISEGTLISELKEDLPILIEHFRELGPEGEEQIARITAEAERLGLNIEEIDALVQAAFAPETMESIAAQFGITNDQVRALSELLGVQVQTDLERMAAQLGLTVEEFGALGAAVEEQFGIPAEQIDELLASLGVSAADLAEALGVEVAEGAGGLTAETAAANAELNLGVGLSAQLAFNLERAAAASGGINIPNFNAGALPDVSAAGGFFSPKLASDTLIQAHAGEAVSIGQPGGGGGKSIIVQVTVNGVISDTNRIAQELGPAIAKAIDLDAGGAGSATRRQAQR